MPQIHKILREFVKKHQVNTAIYLYLARSYAIGHNKAFPVVTNHETIEQNSAMFIFFKIWYIVKDNSHDLMRYVALVNDSLRSDTMLTF